MKQPIVISPRLVERLRLMPASECRLMFDTLLSDEILNQECVTALSPEQEITYMLFHDMVMRDTRQHSAQLAKPRSLMVS